MECHEGATMIKTFRGLLADGAQETIALHTNDGSVGYKIVKFAMIGNFPGTTEQESIIKIYKVAQTTIDNVCDFSDNTLLAAGFYSSDDNVDPPTTLITFDQEIFNQDIYITHSEVNGVRGCNYYIELEQVSLDINQSTTATLKDIRNTTAPI